MILQPEKFNHVDVKLLCHVDKCQTDRYRSLSPSDQNKEAYKIQERYARAQNVKKLNCR